VAAQFIFWDVDTQVDFILPGRPLYVPGAEEILPRLEELTAYARREGIPILGSEDSHSLSDPEISQQPDWVSTYPPHCLAGSEGQRRVPETAPRDPLYLETDALPARRLAELVSRHRGEILFRKQRFDAFTNPNVEPVLDLLRPSAVVIYGVAHDVCVRFAVEGFLRRGRETLFVVTDAIRALDAGRAEALLEDWRARGVHAVTTSEVLAGALHGAAAGAG
jgi:nicotinamidase/pyrazinamidase